jgi:hypothetical protein
VCEKDVKHEYTAILNHLRVKHNMTLTIYTLTYIKPVQNIAGIMVYCEIKKKVPNSAAMQIFGATVCTPVIEIELVEKIRRLV